MSDEYSAYKVIRWTVIAGVCTALLIAVPTTLLGYMGPTWMHIQRDTVKQSHQYVEGKESMLLQLMQKYDETSVDILIYQDHPKIQAGMKGQQRSLLTQIHTEASRLPEDALSTYITTFIETNPL